MEVWSKEWNQIYENKLILLVLQSSAWSVLTIKVEVFLRYIHCYGILSKMASYWTLSDKESCQRVDPVRGTFIPKCNVSSSIHINLTELQNNQVHVCIIWNNPSLPSLRLTDVISSCMRETSFSWSQMLPIMLTLG